MQESEFEDAKTLWKMYYANHGFRRAEAAARYILDNTLETDNPLFHPLVVAVYVFYGKPFKKSFGVGKLSEDIVPVELRRLHEELLIHRDQIYAHQDANAFELPGFGKANQVRVLRLQDRAELFATDFHARHPLMPSIINLCKQLQEKTQDHINMHMERYIKDLPQQNGEYSINITDQNGEFFIKQTAMLNHG